MFQIRERMKALGMTQVRLIFELRERGIVVQPPEMSQILSGVNTYPKATRVLEMVKQILSDLEAKEKKDALNYMDRDLLLIAKDDEFGRALQDLNLRIRRRAPKKKSVD